MSLENRLGRVILSGLNWGTKSEVCVVFDRCNVTLCAAVLHCVTLCDVLHCVIWEVVASAHLH